MRLSTILVLLVSAALPTIFAAPVIPRDNVLIDVPAGLMGRVVEAPLDPDSLVNISTRSPPPKHQVQFKKSAKMELARLHRHDHAQIMKYHETVIKQDMAKHGAHRAVIHHLEHEGGSNPFETLHMTASYYDKKGKLIKSPYAIQKEAKTGTKTHGLFHVRPEEQFYTPQVPQAWKDALRADEPRVEDARRKVIMQQLPFTHADDALS